MHTDGQLSHGAAEFVGDRLQFAHFGLLLFAVLAGDLLFEPVAALERGSRVDRHAVLILATEYSARQWAPSHGADAYPVVNVGQIEFGVLALKHIVLGLFTNGRY